jgi:hypothetical protein
MRRLFDRLRRRIHVMIRKEAPPAPARSGSRPPGPVATPAGPAAAQAVDPSESSIDAAESSIDAAESSIQPAEPAAAPPLSIEAACGALRRTVRALCPPAGRLTDAERQRLGGLIFHGATHFVLRVSEILRQQPALSPEPARIHAEGLAGRWSRAIGWATVHGVLAELAELANDCYLREMGGAVEDAQQVMDAYELTQAQGLLRGEAEPGHLEGAVAVAQARVMLQRVQLRQRQARQRGERKLREARAQVGLGPAGAAGAGTGPGTRATRRRRRAEAAGPIIDINDWGEAGRRLAGGG